MTIQSYQNVSLGKYRREAQNVILHDLHPLSNFNNLKLNETFGATIIVVPHFATEKFCFEVFAPMNHICNMIFLLLSRNVSSVLSSFNLRKTPRNK